MERTRRSGRAAWSALLAVLLLAGCAIGPNSKETNALDTAARAFKASVATASPVIASEAEYRKAKALAKLLTGGVLVPDTGCAGTARAVRNALLRAAPADQDAVYADLDTVKPCSLEGVEGAASAESPDADRPVIKALNAYFAGLAAIVSAGDSDAVAAASDRLTKAVGDLAQLGGAPAPAAAAVGFAGKLARMALANAQYAALRHAVLAADPRLAPAAPALIRILRLRQTAWAAQISEDARSVTTLASSALNDPRLISAPALRIEAYDRFAPTLDKLAEALAAARTDPADEVRALITAHHQLAVALRTRRGQSGNAMANAAEILTGAGGLLPQSKPPAGPKFDG